MLCITLSGPLENTYPDRPSIPLLHLMTQPLELTVVWHAGAAQADVTKMN